MRPGPVCACTGPVCMRHDPSVPAYMSFETQKLLEAISHSKLVRIGSLRYVLASTFSIDAKKDLNAQFGQVLSEIWPLKVF